MVGAAIPDYLFHKHIEKLPTWAAIFVLAFIALNVLAFVVIVYGDRDD